MILLFQYGVSKQGIARLMDMLMAQGNASTESKFLSLAYIELFYFSMYLFITLQTIVLAMLFRGVKWGVFTYEDNLLLKLLFWPVLLSIWLGFTLIRFY